MKYLLLLTGLSALFATAAIASEGPCASFGEYGAMRAFKMEGGKSSNRTEFEPRLVKTHDEKSLYLVIVSEGRQQVASYFVTTEALQASCKILDVTRTSVNDF